MKKVFLGSWPGIIFGILGSAAIVTLDFVYKGLLEAGTIFNYRFEIRFDFFDRRDLYIVLICILLGYIWIFFGNLERYFKGEKDFNLFKAKDVTEISSDKRKAQQRPIPKQFLSKVPDGLTLGMKGKKYVRLPFTDSPEHQLIIGSPGSGKSTTILNALLWNFNFEKNDKKLGAVLAIDVKPELQKKSSLKSDPHIRIIDPTKMDKTDPYNFGFDLFFGLNKNSSDDKLKERMERIARSIIHDLEGDNAHFSGNAQKLLSGFLMYGFRKGLSFSDTISKIMSLSVEDHIAEIISDLLMRDHPKIVNKVRVFDGNQSNEMASIKDTMERDLNTFDTDSVKYCLSDNPNRVTPEDLLNGISVFLSIPDHLVEMYKTVFGLIMELSLSYLQSIPEEQLTDNHPIWCLIDEGGTVYVPSLLDVASRGRSKKIQLSIIVQSYSQLEGLYGKDMALAIKDCCRTTIIFSCNDNRTANMFSEWCGNYRETKYAYSNRNSDSSYSSGSTNSSFEYRPCIDISDIKNLERYDQVLVFVKGYWFLVQKAPYYKIKQLNEKSEEIIRENLSSKEAG